MRYPSICDIRKVHSGDAVYCIHNGKVTLLFAEQDQPMITGQPITCSYLKTNCEHTIIGQGKSFLPNRQDFSVVICLKLRGENTVASVYIGRMKDNGEYCNCYPEKEDIPVVVGPFNTVMAMLDSCSINYQIVSVRNQNGALYGQYKFESADAAIKLP